MTVTVTGVCTNRPRPSTQNNHSKGSQYWKRDVWHALSWEVKNKTVCGRDCTEWLMISQIPVDDNFCSKCLTAQPDEYSGEKK
jgi:hypothetical protein